MQRIRISKLLSNFFLSFRQDITINESDNMQVINNNSKVGESVSITGCSDGSSITINGTKYSGRNLTINGDNVIIDGTTVTTGPKIEISIKGNVESLKTGSADVTITGEAGAVKAGSGNIYCGDVQGNASSGSGNIKCGNIKGNASTRSGDIKHR